MRIFVRISGLTVIGLCIIMILMSLLDLNIRKDEVDKISAIAMSNTQIVMQENIEDRYFGTSNARTLIASKYTYDKLYRTNLAKLQTTDGVYKLSITSDYLKGLMSVTINYEYKNFLGQTKTIHKKLTNIIEVEIDET